MTRPTSITLGEFSQHSFEFGGTDEVIDIPFPTADLETTTVGSFGGWFKADGGSVSIGFGDSGANTQIMIQSLTSGTNIWRTFATNAGAQKFDIRTDAGHGKDEWTHVFVVQNATTPTIYINGVAVAQTDNSSNDKTWWFNDFTAGAIDNIVIGGNAISPQAFYVGSADEVCVFDTNLTAAQVVEIYNSGVPGNLLNHSSIANLISWWRMGENSTWDGTNWTIPDQIGTNNGTSDNMELTDRKTDTPWNQYSMSFDGSNESVNIDSVLTSNLSNDTVGSWSCWVKPVDATPVANETFIAFAETAGLDFLGLFYRTTGELVVQAYNGTVRWELNPDVNPLSDGVWTHLTIVQNGTSPVLYVDGVAVAQTFSTSTDKTWWFSDGTDLDNGRIGAYSWNSGGDTNHFSGNIDEVGFFDTALTAAEVTELYNAGHPFDLNNHSKSGNLVSYFRMGEGATFSTNWSIPDDSNNNNNTATSVNMEEADRVSATA